jgi:hypothetical protein
VEFARLLAASFTILAALAAICVYLKQPNVVRDELWYGSVLAVLQGVFSPLNRQGLRLNDWVSNPSTPHISEQMLRACWIEYQRSIATVWEWLEDVQTGLQALVDVAENPSRIAHNLRSSADAKKHTVKRMRGLTKLSRVWSELRLAELMISCALQMCFVVLVVHGTWTLMAWTMEFCYSPVYPQAVLGHGNIYHFPGSKYLYDSRVLIAVTENWLCHVLEMVLLSAIGLGAVQVVSAGSVHPTSPASSSQLLVGRWQLRLLLKLLGLAGVHFVFVNGAAPLGYGLGVLGTALVAFTFVRVGVWLLLLFRTRRWKWKPVGSRGIYIFLACETGYWAIYWYSSLHPEQYASEDPQPAPDYMEATSFARLFFAGVFLFVVWGSKLWAFMFMCLYQTPPSNRRIPH